MKPIMLKNYILKLSLFEKLDKEDSLHCAFSVNNFEQAKEYLPIMLEAIKSHYEDLENGK
jgi:hypothetical protein